MMSVDSTLSVGIVLSRTQTMEFSFFFFLVDSTGIFLHITIQTVYHQRFNNLLYTLILFVAISQNRLHLHFKLRSNVNI
jgi:hypothetical protein